MAERPIATASNLFRKQRSVDPDDENTALKGDWIEAQFLTSADSVAGDRMGASMGLSGSFLVVGAPSADSGGGAAYIFERTRPFAVSGAADDPWTGPIQRFSGAADDPAGRFGWSVAAASDIIAVGAPHDDADTSALLQLSGAVYIYRLSRLGVWELMQKVKGHPDRIMYLGLQDRFGWACDIDNQVYMI